VNKTRIYINYSTLYKARSVILARKLFFSFLYICIAFALTIEINHKKSQTIGTLCQPC
ncbi:hypothetical protein L9F63_024186, partial [Diploptera punctata]